MSQTQLREINDQMRELLRAGRYSEAISLGHHVLQYYPKHLQTYRVLAEASLQLSDLDAAADLFHRILSADPENVVALVGLSMVHERRGQLEEAVWHLQRAFEIQPTNLGLRSELLRLCSQFEPAPRTRLALTGAGLGRLYARQGLYQQAVQEFRSILHADPSRLDVKVALAEVLYRDGRKQEAAAVAQSLLEQLPYCLKANLLLGALYQENEASEGETLLQRAQALDPERALARELQIDHFAEAAEPTLPPPGEAPISTNLYGDGDEAPTDAAAAATRDLAPSESFAPSSTPEISQQEATPTNEEMPAWLSETAQTAPPAAPSGSELPDWLAGQLPVLDQVETQAGDQPPVEPDEIPAWLAEITSEAVLLPTAKEEQVGAAPASPEMQEAEVQVPSAELATASAQPELEAVASSAEVPVPSEQPVAEIAAPSVEPIAEAPTLSETVEHAEALTPPLVEKPAPTSLGHSLPALASPTLESGGPGGWGQVEAVAPSESVELAEASTPPIVEEREEAVTLSGEPQPVEAVLAAAEVEPALAPAPSDEHLTQAAALSVVEEKVEAVSPIAEVREAPFADEEKQQQEEKVESETVATAPTGVTSEESDWYTLETGTVGTPPEQASVTAIDQPASALAEPVPAPAQVEVELASAEQAEQPPAPPEPTDTFWQARAARSDGNMTAALELYEKVLQHSPALIPEVIIDLEQLVEQPDAVLRAHRLLGDAYSLIGRYKEALEQYRIVLGKG